MRIHVPFIALAALLSAPALFAQAPQNTPFIGYSYADYADLGAGAPIVAVGQVREAIRIKEAPGVPAGHARFYVETDVHTLIRGAQGLPSQIRYLADVRLDPANRAPKLRKLRVILFAAPVGGRPGEVQLVARDGQLAWTLEAETTVRAIVQAASGRDAPPQITGIGNAFHVPGAVPGESETQIFLATQDGRPVSLNVLRRPGEAPRWAVALGEMVDEAAKPPARDTLLWYRLACTLPAALPAASTSALTEPEARAAQEDYRFVRANLGACMRTRPGR